MRNVSEDGRKLSRRARVWAAMLLCTAVGCASRDALDLSGMSFAPEPLVGKIVWNDLITEDIDATRRFYGELFGWTFENAMGPGHDEYWVARSGNVYVAGLVSIAPRADGAVLSRWLPYVSVVGFGARTIERGVVNTRSSGAILAVREITR